MTASIHPSTPPALDLDIVQTRRRWFAAAMLVALMLLALLAHPVSAFGGAWHEGVEAVGLACIALAIGGRAWCSLYIGGRKKVEIVDRGPYSVTRNPLYDFSFIGAFGIGAQTGSLVVASAFALGAVAVFLRTVDREEAWLRETFGSAFDAYCAITPRFLPDFRKWRDEEELVVKPVFFLRTIRDGLTLLLAIPVMEGIEWLQLGNAPPFHLNLF